MSVMVEYLRNQRVLVQLTGAWKTTLHKPANPNKKSPQQAESIIDVFINRRCTQVREESSASVR